LARGVAVSPGSLPSELETGAGGATRPTSRIGGGGQDNYMVDGLTTMDPGVTRPSSRISAESISEVKVSTFGYGAEYGRSSGNQINAVTKSGTNQFRGALYDLERRSDGLFGIKALGYANSKTNILNGDPQTSGSQRDYGCGLRRVVRRPR